MIDLTAVAATRYRNLNLLGGLKLQPLNIFIGPNGSGKTNMIKLLQFLKSLIAGPVDDTVSGEQLAHAAGILGGAKMMDRSRSFPGTINVTYEFTPPSDLRDKWKDLRLELGLYAHSPDSPVSLRNEALKSTHKYLHDQPYGYYVFHDKEIGKGVVSYYDAPEKLKSHYEKLEDVPTGALGLAVLPELLEKFPHPPDMTPVYPIRRQLIDYVKKWHFYNANDMNFEVIRMSEPKIGPSDIYLSRSGDNLALVLENLVQKHLDFDERLDGAMKSILPLTRRVRAVRTGLMGLTVEWFLEDMNSPFYLNEISDGTVRMLCWATVLLSPILPTLLVIDEPEMGIHPAWLPKLSDWIKSASQRTGVIVSTHSPDLLDHFTDTLENVTCFSTKDRGRHFSAEPLSFARLESKLKEGWQLGDLYRVGDPLIGGWPW